MDEIIELCRLFSYDRATGMLTRTSGQFCGKVQDVVSGRYYVTYAFKRAFKVHRVVWAIEHGSWPDGDIDHIDGNGLNNRLENLRVTTKAGNAHNRRSTGSTGNKAKGVRKRSDRDSYRADIYVGNRAIFLGCFKTHDEAAHEYNKAAIRYHGEFACLNPVGT